MKRFLFFCLATLLIASLGVAQEPTPATSLTPAPTPAGLQPSAPNRINAFVLQMISQSNSYGQSIQQVLKDGVPAQNGSPAISAKEIRDALGPGNVARLEAAAKALGFEGK